MWGRVDLNYDPDEARKEQEAKDKEMKAIHDRYVAPACWRSATDASLRARRARR